MVYTNLRNLNNFRSTGLSRAKTPFVKRRRGHPNLPSRWSGTRVKGRGSPRGRWSGTRVEGRGSPRGRWSGTRVVPCVKVLKKSMASSCPHVWLRAPSYIDLLSCQKLVSTHAPMFFGKTCMFGTLIYLCYIYHVCILSVML